MTKKFSFITMVKKAKKYRLFCAFLRFLFVFINSNFGNFWSHKHISIKKTARLGGWKSIIEKLGISALATLGDNSDIYEGAKGVICGSAASADALIKLAGCKGVRQVGHKC